MGGGKHTISAKPPSPDGIPPMPGYLNPNGPTGGKPFYLQADGSVKPMPIDPSKLASDKDAAQQALEITLFSPAVANCLSISNSVAVRSSALPNQ